VKQHSQLASNRNDGLTLGLLAASGSQMETPLLKCRIPSVRSEDVVGALDQQASKICVAGEGDAKLRIMVSGLTASWSQAEVTTHIATWLETLLVAES
jgi:hypothetical protein